ncbi:MAG: ATP-binding cassette domain-containing protein [Gammaproteobacteria bacterium]|nr:ATP-binding cassette domain-containing protein [Gammaproteobacteria bacterium]
MPEVVQTSAMDCGPATLKCILEGFGVSVSYGRLREACQTDVDGTSIDVMEDVAVQLGLDAEQVMVPADHLLLPETQTLPAIVVVRLPNGLTHFVVVWRLHGPVIQMMDPGTGRLWRTHRQFLGELYIHTHPVPVQGWREWAGSEGFCDPLLHRMARTGLDEKYAEQLIENALADPGWYSIAALDASTRMVDALIRADGLDRGSESGKVLESFFADTCKETPGEMRTIPLPYWSVQLPPEQGEEEMLLLKGAVLVRVLGRMEAPFYEEQADEAVEVEEVEEFEEQARFSPELLAALEEKPTRPELEILRLLREDGLLVPWVLLAALAMSVFCVTTEAMLFRALLDIGTILNLTGQRVGAMAFLFMFVTGMLILEIPVSSVIRRMGRRLETRLRVAFLEKIPRLSDRYFHSRLTSDMTQRIHELRAIRTLPALGVSFIRTCFQIMLTALGVVILFPGSAMIAVLATICFMVMAFAAQPLLLEQDMRLRTHLGGLSHFYLDALLGLIPVRTHRAERSLRREHEGLLAEWVRTSKDFLKTTAFIRAAEGLTGSAFTVWIVFDFISKGGEPGGLLLLFYWTLNLPTLGKALADFAQQYPMQRSMILRLLEPLGAPEETDIPDGGDTDERGKDETPPEDSAGIGISLENVSVQAGGHTILSNIDLHIRPGEHIGIVGPSGAGKSSLVGLLLGWHRPSRGQVRVHRELLRGERLRDLRRTTAWVDPEVQLWNRSLFENFRYGSQGNDTGSLNAVVEEADLFDVLERLPQGMQTRMGEAGRLVSGGEGQRVRLGRAMFRSGVRLAILDEPFRGLDREKRRILLTRARKHWQDATLIFISHDVGETKAFDRVLVIEDGRLVEDDRPELLMENQDSRFRALVEAEEAVRKGLWESADWRRLWLADGKVEER